jgi:DNA-binding NarL/FixJ family response regulator
MVKKKCIIIDHDPGFSTMLVSKSELTEILFFVNTYSQCQEAINNLARDFPDIVLMDIDFFGVNVPDAINRIRCANSRVEIVIISNNTDDQIILNALSAGATGYLLKSNCLSDLKRYLEIQISGRSVVDPLVARKIINSMHSATSSPLTARETEVMKGIAHGKTSSAIARDLGISAETSKTHIKNIYKKLKVNSKNQAVTKAITEKLINLNVFFEPRIFSSKVYTKNCHLTVKLVDAPNNELVP